MSADRDGGPPARYADLPGSLRRKLIRDAVLRPLGSAIALVVIYFVMPMEDLGSMTAVGGLVLGLLLIAIVFVWQVRRILRSRYPGVQAIEGLSIAVPTYLLAFAATFHMMSVSTVANFSEYLSRLDAVYFSREGPTARSRCRRGRIESAGRHDRTSCHGSLRQHAWRRRQSCQLPAG